MLFNILITVTFYQNYKDGANYKNIEIMFETYSLGQPFDFNVMLQDKEPFAPAFDGDDDFPEDVLLRTHKMVCFSSRGSHKHNWDQFDFIAQSTFTLAAVYDGHGGSSVSLYLKKNLLKNIVNHSKFSSQPSESLAQCVREIQEEVVTKFQPTCGSTLLIVLWTKKEILVVSVGDGLCYGFKAPELAGQDQSSNESSIRNCQKMLLNEIHNLQNEEQRRRIRGKSGLILKLKNSYRVAGELSLSRSIGDSKYKEWISAVPSIKIYDSQIFSHIVIASDGFSKALKLAKQPQNVIDLLENTPYFKDNATFLFLQCPTNHHTRLSL